MKIIEALKELPLLEKRIEKNVQLIQTYSSELQIGEGKFTFGNEDTQKGEVASLVQSTDDLIARRAEVRRLLAITNATVEVTIGKYTRTITEWIEYRQKGIALQIKVQSALNDNTCGIRGKSLANPR